jgi:hypothetical protein
MNACRCQICGRSRPLRKNGTIAHHCVGGPQCPGTGHPPIERDDAWLIAYTDNVEAAYRRAYDAVRALEEARANWIDPALIIRCGLLAGQSLKLRRRLKRHLSWPDRYRRSMDRFGWATPPPEYLAER